MEKQEKTIILEDNELIHKKIDKASRVFDIISMINIGIILIYAVYLFINSSMIIQGFSGNMFYRIPYVGNLLFMVAKSLNLLDIPIINNTLQPVLIFEIIYYTLPLLIFQIILFVLKRRVLTKENSYFSFIFIYIIVFALAIVKQFQTLLIFSTQRPLMEFRGFLIMIFLIAQIVCITIVAHQMSKIERFNMKGIFTHQFAHRLSKTGAIISIVILGIFGAGLFGANMAVDQVKDKVSVNYVFDLKAAADGTVSIVLPKELVRTSKLVGVDLPETLQGGQLVEYFFQEQIDFGAMVTQALIGTIDSIAYNYIVSPLVYVTTTLLLIVVALVLHYVNGKVGIPPLVLYGIQFLLMIAANMIYAPRFGIIVSIGLALLLVGSLFHVFTEFRNTHLYERITTALHTLKNLSKQNA